MHNDAHGKPLAKPPKSITKESQILGSRLLREGQIRHLEVLSLDLLSNGINSLHQMGAVRKEKRYIVQMLCIKDANLKVNTMF